MSWQQFKYIFSRDVEHAMRYSIEEALRREDVFDRKTTRIVDDAVESFKRKMETHTK